VKGENVTEQVLHLGTVALFLVAIATLNLKKFKCRISAWLSYVKLNLILNIMIKLSFPAWLVMG